MPGPPPPPGPPPVVKSEAPPPPSALLKSIEKGKKLKKTVTNDRSQPMVDAKVVSSGGGHRSPPMQRAGMGSHENISNSGASAGGVGGLFAGGIPKLRPTGGNVSNYEKPSNAPPRPVGSSNAKPNVAPVPVFPRPGGNPPAVASRANHVITKSPPIPPPVAQRQSPAPPVANRNIPPANKRASYQQPQTQPKPSFSISPNISPRGSEIGSPLTKPGPGSPRGSGNSLNSNTPPPHGQKTLTDGKWTFSNDIPPPRSFPSGEIYSGGYGRKMPPPPPNRSSTSKKPAPAPPQRHY